MRRKHTGNPSRPAAVGLRQSNILVTSNISNVMSNNVIHVLPNTAHDSKFFESLSPTVSPCSL